MKTRMRPTLPPTGEKMAAYANMGDLLERNMASYWPQRHNLTGILVPPDPHWCCNNLFPAETILKESDYRRKGYPERHFRLPNLPIAAKSQIFEQRLNRVAQQPTQPILPAAASDNGNITWHKDLNLKRPQPNAKLGPKGDFADISSADVRQWKAEQADLREQESFLNRHEEELVKKIRRDDQDKVTDEYLAQHIYLWGKEGNPGKVSQPPPAPSYEPHYNNSAARESQPILPWERKYAHQRYSDPSPKMATSVPTFGEGREKVTLKSGGTQTESAILPEHFPSLSMAYQPLGPTGHVAPAQYGSERLQRNTEFGDKFINDRAIEMDPLQQQPFSFHTGFGKPGAGAPRVDVHGDIVTTNTGDPEVHFPGFERFQPPPKIETFAPTRRVDHQYLLDLKKQVKDKAVRLSHDREFQRGMDIQTLQYNPFVKEKPRQLTSSQLADRRIDMGMILSRFGADSYEMSWKPAKRQSQNFKQEFNKRHFWFPTQIKMDKRLEPLPFVHESVDLPPPKPPTPLLHGVHTNVLHGRENDQWWNADPHRRSLYEFERDRERNVAAYASQPGGALAKSLDQRMKNVVPQRSQSPQRRAAPNGFSGHEISQNVSRLNEGYHIMDPHERKSVLYDGDVRKPDYSTDPKFNKEEHMKVLPSGDHYVKADGTQGPKEGLYDPFGRSGPRRDEEGNITGRRQNPERESTESLWFTDRKRANELYLQDLQKAMQRHKQKEEDVRRKDHDAYIPLAVIMKNGMVGQQQPGGDYPILKSDINAPFDFKERHEREMPLKERYNEDLTYQANERQRNKQMERDMNQRKAHMHYSTEYELWGKPRLPGGMVEDTRLSRQPVMGVGRS